jgi:replicative DNA helicase
VTPVAQLAEAAPIAPPQNLEAEESVLGAMLLSPGAIGAVSEVLDASDFYRESHAKIYRAGLALYAKGEPVDAITLVDELEERSELEAVGGRVRMHELAALVPATANAAHYARIVREMATLRGLIAAGQQIAQLGWERPGETQILVDRAEQVVFELSQSRVSTEFSHIEELLKESFERITALYEAGADVTGVPSGFRDLDRLTSDHRKPAQLLCCHRRGMAISQRKRRRRAPGSRCWRQTSRCGRRSGAPLHAERISPGSEVTKKLPLQRGKVESQRAAHGQTRVDIWPHLVVTGDRKLMKAPVYVDDTGRSVMILPRSAPPLRPARPGASGMIVNRLPAALMTSGTGAEGSASGGVADLAQPRTTPRSRRLR